MTEQNASKQVAYIIHKAEGINVSDRSSWDRLTRGHVWNGKDIVPTWKRDEGEFK